MEADDGVSGQAAGVGEMRRRSFVSLVGAGLLSAIVPGVGAQAAYPERPITVIVPYAAGGALAVFGQRLVLKMGPRLRGNLVVDPRGGAGGLIGTQMVARAKPDGYTLLLAATGSQIISPLTHTEPPFDPLKDFTPIALLTRQPMVLAVHPALPATSLQELISLLKRAPGKYAYASAGTGALGHLTAEMFLRQAGGLDATHVPYKGGGPAITDVIAGNVAFTWEVMSSLVPHHASGKLRIISVAGEKRASALPQVPTAIEGGLPEFVSLTQQFLLAPAGTPSAVVAQLSKAAQASMADPDFQRELAVSGIEAIADSTPATTTQVISKELERWRPVVKAANLRPVE